MLRLIPAFPMVGTSGFFSASDFVVPIFGLILGPYVGAASTILGTFLAITLGKPVIFLGLDFLPATIGTLAVGLLATRKFLHLTGLYILLLALFMLNPLSLLLIALPNGVQVPYNWLHFVGLVLLISPWGRKAASWAAAPPIGRLALGMAMLFFIGTMAQHLMGGLLYELVLGSLLGVIEPNGWASIWTVIFYLYPIERIFITILATIIGTATSRALRGWINLPIFR